MTPEERRFRAAALSLAAEADELVRMLRHSACPFCEVDGNGIQVREDERCAQVRRLAEAVHALDREWGR